jgi:hypothetical protein
MGGAKKNVALSWRLLGCGVCWHAVCWHAVFSGADFNLT